MQEERHEPYVQPPPTEQEQAKAEEMTRPPVMRPEGAEQPAMRVEEAEGRVQEAPTKPPEREAEERKTLLSPEQREQYRSRWKDIQIEFLTDPRKSAEDANRLVDEMVQDINKQLADRCSKMEQEWQQGKPSTEDLRLALGHYRSFFDQLLSV